MGRAVIFLSELIHPTDENKEPYVKFDSYGNLIDEDKIKDPSWFPVSFDYGDAHNPETDGMILVSFSMHEYERLNNFQVRASDIRLY